MNTLAPYGSAVGSVFRPADRLALSGAHIEPDHARDRLGEPLTLEAVAVEILMEGETLYRFDHELLADRIIIGMFRPSSTYRMTTAESLEPLNASPAFVRIDPRVLREVERKKPIGVTRTGWVNLLLQRAIASEPEPLPRD